MKKAKKILQRLLFPPAWTLFAVPPAVFAALIIIFVTDSTESAAAYIIYCMSAYSLAVCLARFPAAIRAAKRFKENFSEHSALLKKFRSTDFGGNYIGSRIYRARVSIFTGMSADFLYAVFRLVTGIFGGSVWFISMAAYHAVLGALRAYLLICCRKRKKYSEKERLAYEFRCYGRTAKLLFLLNIPMGGMILLMIKTNSGFSYPGYVIYLSALYTFYMFTVSIVNLFRFRRLGSPVLSAAKALNFTAALMSLLGLQTAMIAQFSEENEGFRVLMNTLTGSGVYFAVAAAAIYMAIRAKREEANVLEQIRK